jgi:hypothetical protein
MLGVITRHLKFFKSLLSWLMFFVIGIIDYNFLCFREAIQQVFELRNKNQVLMALTTNHHSNIINSQNATVNSETQNITLNSAAVQSWRYKVEPVVLLLLAEHCRWMLIPCTRMDVCRYRFRLKKLNILMKSNFILISMKNLFLSYLVMIRNVS